MLQPGKIKVFIASPSDVTEERNALAKLIADINDVLAFLAPEKSLSIELVRYETHSYPDLGAPQDVINREIPVDYDIFVGVMWKRIGTPTATEPSGTVEEFRRACARRKQGSLPRIMFYFCDERITIPDDDEELEQLRQVMKFRKELDLQGLTSSYPSHAEFTETVRGGLLRAIRDILGEAERSPAARKVVQAPPPGDTASRDAALALAKEYDRTRMTRSAGDERTRLMEGIFTRMKVVAPKVQAFLESFERDGSAGVRLAAIAILNMFPNREHLDWLAERLNPEMEKPFVGYHAAVALLDAVTNLPLEDCSTLSAALAKARDLGSRLKGDPARLNVLARAEQELARKCKAAS